MARGRCYRRGSLTDDEVTVDSLGDLITRDDTFVWLDLDGDDLGKLGEIGTQLGLHPIETEDAGERRSRPGIRIFGDHVSASIRPVGPKGGGIDSDDLPQVDVFCGPRYLVTVRSGFPAERMDQIAQGWESQLELLANGGGYALYVLLDRTVDDYLGAVERFEDAADDLEDVVFEEGADRSSDAEIRERLFRLKRETVLLRRVASPLREGIQLLTSTPELVSAPLQPYLRDVLDHVVRLDEMLDNVRDLLTSLLELRVAQAANRMNEVMKSLTAWASILLVPTLLTGVWGMNFAGMPELNWRYGYLIALGTIVGSAFGLYAWFRFRKHWL